MSAARPARPEKERLLRQMSEMQIRLQEAEDTLNAIRSGAVDALVVHTPQGEQLFTLRGADQSYRALVEAMNEGAVTVSGSIVSFCNSHFAEMLALPMELIFGASIFDLVQAEAFPDFLRRIQKGRVTRGQIEAKVAGANGKEIPVILSASRFESDGKVSVGLVVSDMSERKEAERARQDLSRNILNAQEQERQRVARDLHDSVNQLLSSAKFRLSSTTKDEVALLRKNAEQARDLVEKAIAEVRLISRNLRPSELDDLGLIAALRSLANDFEERTGIESRFKSDQGLRSERFERDLAMTLYRIAQEALNNVEKHSKATWVELLVQYAPPGFVLTIRDNGRGFAPRSASSQKSGWGLDNMAERAALIGGAFQTLSTPGKGTEISVRVPILKRR